MQEYFQRHICMRTIMTEGIFFYVSGGHSLWGRWGFSEKLCFSRSTMMAHHGLEMWWNCCFCEFPGYLLFKHAWNEIIMYLGWRTAIHALHWALYNFQFDSCNSHISLLKVSNVDYSQNLWSLVVRKLSHLTWRSFFFSFDSAVLLSF